MTSSGVFIVNFEHSLTPFSSVYIVVFEQVNVNRVHSQISQPAIFENKPEYLLLKSLCTKNLLKVNKKDSTTTFSLNFGRCLIAVVTKFEHIHLIS